MSEIKFKVEVKGVEVKEGDIIDVIIGTDYACSGKIRTPFITKHYTGRIVQINNQDKDILLDVSKEYEAKTVKFSLDCVESIKIKYISK